MKKSVNIEIWWDGNDRPWCSRIDYEKDGKKGWSFHDHISFVDMMEWFRPKVEQLSPQFNLIERKQTMVEKLKDWKHWLKGLVAAAIGGAANGLVLTVVDPLMYNFQDGFGSLMTVVLTSGAVAAAMYLKQSPLPGVEGN